MIDQPFLNALQTIIARIGSTQLNWAVTGSLGMALQGMDLDVHDIDLQTISKALMKLKSSWPIASLCR